MMDVLYSRILLNIYCGAFNENFPSIFRSGFTKMSTPVIIGGSLNLKGKKRKKKKK